MEHDIFWELIPPTYKLIWRGIEEAQEHILDETPIFEYQSIWKQKVCVAQAQVVSILFVVIPGLFRSFEK